MFVEPAAVKGFLGSLGSRNREDRIEILREATERHRRARASSTGRQTSSPLGYLDLVKKGLTDPPVLRLVRSDAGRTLVRFAGGRCKQARRHEPAIHEENLACSDAKSLLFVLARTDRSLSASYPMSRVRAGTPSSCPCANRTQSRVRAIPSSTNNPAAGPTDDVEP